MRLPWGEQRFAYSLLPHAGGWEAQTAAQAYCLNDPIVSYAVKGNKQPVPAPPVSFLSAASPNIIIETIKRAEDGNGFIARFYESQRRRGEVTLTCAFPLARVEKVNIMEETQQALTPSGNQVKLFVKPYEIISLRFS
jgi:alpha-mannosidase